MTANAYSRETGASAVRKSIACTGAMIILSSAELNMA
jgi:hypothetical protein